MIFKYHRGLGWGGVGGIGGFGRSIGGHPATWPRRRGCQGPVYLRRLAGFGCGAGGVNGGAERSFVRVVGRWRERAAGDPEVPKGTRGLF